MGGTTTVMGREGQVTIPKEIRALLGVEEGDQIDFKLEGSRVFITPADGVVARTAGALGERRHGPTPTDKELKEAAERAIAEDVVARTAGAFKQRRHGPTPTIEEIEDAIAAGWAADGARNSDRQITSTRN